MKNPGTIPPPGELFMTPENEVFDNNSEIALFRQIAKLMLQFIENENEVRVNFEDGVFLLGATVTGE